MTVIMTEVDQNQREVVPYPHLHQLQHEVVPDGIIQEAILKYSKLYVNISLPRPECEQ